jgi:hypothetical protein
VTQVNVGAGISIPVPAPVHGTAFPPSPVNLPPTLETLPVAVPAEIGSVLEAAPFVDITDISAVLDPGDVSDVSTAVSATPFAAPAAAATGEPMARTSPLQARDRIPLAPVVRYTPISTSAVDAAWRAASPVSSAGPPAPAQPPQATPRPRAPHEPSRTPVISVSGVSAGAASGAGGGSSGSGLPLLLTLPFVAALLDLARRVALEHATWPTGHRRRVPDRPG